MGQSYQLLYAIFLQPQKYITNIEQRYHVICPRKKSTFYAELRFPPCRKSPMPTMV